MATSGGVLVALLPKSGPGIATPNLALPALPTGPSPTAAFSWALQAQNDGVFISGFRNQSGAGTSA